VRQETQELTPDAIVLSTSYAPHKTPTDPLQVSRVKGMSGMIKAFAPLSSKLVVVQDVPTHPTLPSDCLLRAGATYGSCAQAVWPSEASTDSKIEAATRAAHGAFMSTNQWFCARGRCPDVVGNTIAYVDYDHVSQTYSRQLRTSFSKGLATIVGG
jgi:hypothetical protein